jgi:IK cytokine
MSLANADFRAFLSSDAQPSHTQNASTATPEEIAARAKAKEERRRKYAGKAKAHSGAKASATEASSSSSTAETATKYRDRAEERRKGLVRDDNDAIDASRFTEQETKHLGGDVEHTHLVKGLDFTLLARVRAEAQQQQQTAAAAPPLASATPLQAVPAQRSATRIDEVSVSPTNCVARTSLGNRILKLVFPPEPPAQNARMLPGRVFYSFDLGQKIPPLPKIVVRANDDVPELVHVMTGVEKLVLARVSRAVAEWRDPTACARKLAADRARVAAEQNAVAAAVEAARQALAEADDDIFADAGSYVASIAPEPASAVGESAFDVELRAAQLADDQVAAARRVESNDHDDGDTYPNTDDAYPNTDDAYPNTDDAYPRTIEDEEEPDNGVELDAGDEDSDDVNERARQLLKARGLAVEDDEYGMIGVTSVRLSVAREDDAKSDKRKRGGGPPQEKQVEQKKAQKFDRDLRVVASLVDKKAEARGAKRLIGEHIGAPEKKRK